MLRVNRAQITALVDKISHISYINGWVHLNGSIHKRRMP